MSTTRPQDIILSPIREMGLGQFPIGICKGYTGAFLEYFLHGKKDQFIKLIEFIRKTPDLVKKLKAFKERIKSHDEDLTAEEAMCKEVLELFNMMKVYQDNQFRSFEATSRTINTKEQGALTPVYADELIYSFSEWCDYLAELRDIMREEKTPVAITIRLKCNMWDPDNNKNVDHVISLSYDHRQDAWCFADINFLPYGPPPIQCENIDETNRDSLGIDPSELKKIPPKAIKNALLPNTLKSYYFDEGDYISATINIYTSENNPRLEQIKLNFAESRKSQQVYVSTIPHLATRVTANKDTMGHLAAENNDLDKLMHLKELTGKNKDGNTLLHVAAIYNSYEATEWLLQQNKIFIHQVNDGGVTAAFFAAQCNSAEVLKLLAKSGANLNYTRKEKSIRPIHVAAVNNSIEAMKILLQPENKVNIDQATTEGQTAAFYAAAKNHVEILALLKTAGAHLNIPSKQGYFPIHTAARNNATEAIQFLIQSGVNPSQSTEDGKTALHFAASSNGTKAILVLVENKADLNKGDKYGLTPLHTAAAHGHLETVRMFIKLKANILAEAMGGYSPLYYALSEKKWETTILLLVNVPFDRLNAFDKELITKHGRELLKELDKLCSITISGNIDKIKKLQHDIFMLSYQSNKEIIKATKMTPMLDAMGLFKEAVTTEESATTKNQLRQ